MRFFEPTNSFLTWLVKYVGQRPTFDVGCGEAHLTVALQQRGVKCLGIDNRFLLFDQIPVGLHNAVLPQDATQSAILATQCEALTLFCRPNHTGWVAETVGRIHPSTEVLYISKPENFYEDLGRYGFRHRVLATPKAGKEGEKVYQVQRRVAKP
jgi:hypothetical protein